RRSSTRTSNTPTDPGTRAASPNSLSNVDRSSWAIHAARSIQRQPVQYVISTRGICGILRPIGFGRIAVDRRAIVLAAARKVGTIAHESAFTQRTLSQHSDHHSEAGHSVGRGADVVLGKPPS